MKRLIFLFVLFFFCAPSLFAQSPHSYSEFERDLALTEPQKAQVEGIRNKYFNEWQAVRKESTRKRLELKELIRNPAISPGKMGKLENELRELETARSNIYDQYKAEVLRVLNDKQRERYNTFFNTEKRKMMHYPRPERYDR